MNLNKFVKLLLFAIIFTSNSILSAHEYKVTIRGEALKSATLDTNKTEIKTTVSGIQSIISDKPEQIVLELQGFLPIEAAELHQLVVLDKVNILSADAKIIAGSKKSDVEITTSIPIYRGKIGDSENLNLCFTPGGLIGNFHVANKNYGIKPDNTASVTIDHQSHWVQMVNTPECGDNWCKTDLSRIPNEIMELMAKSGEPQLKSTQNQLVAKVAVETDYETYEGFGKDSLKTAAWMLSVIANSSQIFEQEVNVKLEVSYLKVWTNPKDPYAQKGYALMTDFYEYLKNNIKEVKRDVAVLVIKDPARLSGGQGELDQLGNQDLSFLVAGEYAVTHELGHVFGSPHTHDCRWPAGPNGTLAPIDKCASVEGNCGITEVIQQEGTIMSYCGAIKPIFGPLVQHLIRARAELKLGKIAVHMHEVRGKVLCSGVGLSGVAIAFNTLSSGENYNTTTDSNGNYLISLPDNLYSYTASKENYFITPVGSKYFNKQQGGLYVSEVNVNGIDFNALEVKPDPFEPDDSPAFANEIKPDGSVLSRSIHIPWNFDYFKFQAEAGKTYTIVVSSSLFTTPGFNLFDTDGIYNLSMSSDRGSATTQTLIWKAEKSGQYFIQVGQGGQISNYDISVHYNFAVVDSGIAGCISKNADWGDFDNDGDFDLLLSEYWSPFSYKLYTNSKTVFSNIEKSIINPAYGGSSTLKWTDLDNDGDLDIVAGNMYGINAYYNTQGGFSSSKSLTEYAGHPISSIDIGDYDNDGDVDILFPAVTDKKIHILKNEKGVFANISTGLPGIYSGKVRWIDFDNDGDLDIFVVGSTDGNSFGAPLVKIYKNENGKFYDNGPELDQITGEPSFAFGDFDLDGDPDIALAGSLDGQQVLKIYRNNHGFFENINSLISGVWHASLDWGDFDNDGDLDLIMSGMPKVGNANQQTLLLENNNGMFTENRISPTLLQIMGTSNWCDIDGDNALDLFLVGETWNGNQSSLLKNENKVKNATPSAPGNLNVKQISESQTLFFWSPSADDKTPSSSLTYNLRLGTAAGKADILSPNSDLKTGKRLVVGIGNVGYLLNKTINNLNPGTYYWSVQAVDNSYVGSAWATEQSFEVKLNNLPIANAGSDQTVNEGTTVTLDGSLSSDPDGSPLTYKWTAPNGISLSSTSTPKPTFRVPEVKKDSTLIFSLIVNDGFADSSPSTVRINVKNVIKVGVNDVSNPQPIVYPNPTTGVIKIEGLSTTHKNEITIQSIDGKLIRKKITNLAEETIDISDQVSGTYLLLINNQTFKIQKK